MKKNNNDFLLPDYGYFLILKTYVFFKDENNTKPFLFSSEHVFFFIRKTFYTLIFASKNMWRKISLI